MTRQGIITGLMIAFLLAGCGQPGRVPPPEIEPVALQPGLDLSPGYCDDNLHLFDFDARAPLDVQEDGTWREASSTWIDLTYASPRGGRVPATLIIPDGRGPFAGLVLGHGLPSKRQEMYWLGRQYARAGAVVIAIDAPFARPEHAGRPAPPTWTGQDRDEQIQLIVDLRRAVDLLAARSDVDPERMAYLGVSYGGAMGGLLAGVEHRLQAYVLQVGDGGLVEHLTGVEDREGYWPGALYQRSTEIQEGWLAAMWPIEPIHYVGHAAPAALLFQNGTRDTLVPPYDALRYQEAGSEPKDVLWYEAKHGLPEQALLDQAEWLQEAVGTGDLILLDANYRPSAVVVDRLLLAWVLLSVASLAGLAWLLRGSPLPWRQRLLWLLAVVFLGPLGVLAYILSARAVTAWGHALGSTVRHVGAYGAGWLLVSLLALFVPAIQNSVPAALALVFGLPLAAALSLVGVPRLISSLRARIRPTAWQSFLVQVLSANVALAAIYPAFVLPVNLVPYGFGVISPVLLALYSGATLAGVLAAYPLHVWMTRRGLVPGSLLPPAGGEAAGPRTEMPGIRRGRLSGLVVLSYVVLAAVVALTVWIAMQS
jgi:dienelactone hydrolase